MAPYYHFINSNEYWMSGYVSRKPDIFNAPLTISALFNKVLRVLSSDSVLTACLQWNFLILAGIFSGDNLNRFPEMLIPGSDHFVLFIVAFLSRYVVISSVSFMSCLHGMLDTSPSYGTFILHPASARTSTNANRAFSTVKF